MGGAVPPEMEHPVLLQEPCEEEGESEQVCGSAGRACRTRASAPVRGHVCSVPRAGECAQ